MSYTQCYTFQNPNGMEKVIHKNNSEMAYMGFNRLLLNPGQSYSYEVQGEEQALVLQQGDFTATVEYAGAVVLNAVKGNRTSVYDELPTALYLPPGCKVTIASERGMEARLFTAYCETGNAPYFCPPENVEEGEPGAYIYKRKYRFIFGAPGKHNDHITKKLIVGESVSVPGGWIGFPAHRHDYETSSECVLDEIFSYQVTGPNDFGSLMCVAFDMDDTGKKLWDEITVIESNDTAVALPTGYHSTLALPGSTVYLLWGLAGPQAEKCYQVQFDERFSSLEDCLY